MDANTLNDLAHSLATLSVTGDRAPLEKAAAEYLKQADLWQQLQGYGNQAAGAAKDLYAKAQPHLANPYVRNSLIGMGAGGLVGMLQPKRKLRSALTYGLVGGLGGLGLAHAMNGGALPKTQPDANPQGAPPAAAAAAPNLRKQLAAQSLKEEGLNPGVSSATGAVMGAAGGGVASRGLIRDYLIRRNGMRNLYNVPRSAATPETVGLANKVKSVGGKFVLEGDAPADVVYRPRDIQAARNRAIQEANSLTKLTPRQRFTANAGGILGALGLGWAGSEAGEMAANWANRPFTDAIQGK